jgi:hypothetical protein
MAEMASFGVGYKCSASNESFDQDLLVGDEKRCKINSFGSPGEYARNRHVQESNIGNQSSHQKDIAVEAL